MTHPVRLGCIVAVATGLSACMPGDRPPPVAAGVAPPPSWRDAASGNGVVDPNWWRAYRDPRLDALVEQALQSNTDVLIAATRIDEARGQARLARASLLPRVDATASGFQDRAGGRDTQTVTVGVAASWEVDLFGRLGALDRAARLRFVASRADRDAVALIVARETTRAYVALVALDAQIALTRETVESRADTLRRAEDRASAGYTSQFEYLQARAELERVEAQLPGQELAQRLQENALALLVGGLPRQVGRADTLERLATPLVPATLPSQLVRGRPDIAAAEYALAASDETIAARRADFLPRISLGSDYRQVLSSGVALAPAALWSLGSSILTPLFRSGELTGNLDVAAAQRDRAAYQYRAAVLIAFREVEDALAGQLRYAEQVAAFDRVVTTARLSLVIAQDRYGEGYSDFLSLLDAQRTLFEAQQQRITAQADRLSAGADLAASLGGGWTPPERAAAALENQPENTR